MKTYSKKWMGSFLEGTLPDDKTILDQMSRKAFEVESIETSSDGDSLFEIKVLPNRAPDALSIYGMAKELGTIFSIPVKDITPKSLLSSYELKNEFADIREKEDVEVKKGVTLRANKPVLCFSGLKVTFDNTQPTPDWIKDILTKSGGRPINLLVDLTNLMLFAYGQPAHVFDFDKLKGILVTRYANEGEELELLDGKKVKLNISDYVICDEERALSLAGIKGGKLAEVDTNTTVGVFEMANFNPTMVRKTSQRLGIRTDASKIFENGFSTSVTQGALALLIDVIKEVQPSAHIEFIFQKNIVEKNSYKVGVKREDISYFAGKEFSEKDIIDLLGRQKFNAEYVTIGAKMKETIEAIQKFDDEHHIEYKMGASVSGDAPKFFDCSGLMAYIYKEAGVRIPRTTPDQFVFGTTVAETELQFGDIVFLNSGEGKIWYETFEYKKGTKVAEGVDHCGMNVGENRILHISMKTGKLEMDDVSNAKTFVKDKIIGYKRMADINGKVFVVTPPKERLDIKIAEDVSEEVLRVYGFDNIPAQPINIPLNINQNKRFLFENYLKVKMMNKGFTEVFNYTFVDKGNVKVKLGLASDKEYLRNNLTDGATLGFTKNYNFMPIMQTDIVKFFEIGTVFLSDKNEEKRAIIVMDDNKKKTKYIPEIEAMLSEIETELGLSKIVPITSKEKPAMIEFSIDAIVRDIEANNISVPYIEINKELQDIKYKPISVYPFIVRDIAMWVPEGFSYEKLEATIKSLNLSHVVKMYMFDSFSKEGRTSIAFRIIFQSYEKTLTDVEVESEMNKVNTYLKDSGYEIR